MLAEGTRSRLKFSSLAITQAIGLPLDQSRAEETLRHLAVYPTLSLVVALNLTHFIGVEPLGVGDEEQDNLLATAKTPIPEDGVHPLRIIKHHLAVQKTCRRGR